MSLPRYGLLAALGVLVLSGCASLSLPFSGPELGAFTEQDLRAELSRYSLRFSAGIENAIEQIHARTRDPRVRRTALLWGVRMVPVMQEAALSPRPQEGYLAALTISVMMRRYLTDGAGRALFGPSQDIAVAEAEALEEDALEIGTRFLSERQMRDVLAEVERLSGLYPIQGPAFSFQNVAEVEQVARSSGAVSTLLNAPLAPFRALEGVDAGAQAIQDFNRTANRFAQIVADLPGQLRDQIQLLLYDFEDRDTVIRGLAAFESTAEAADRASEVLAQLPDGLRATLGDSRDVVAEAADAVERAGALVEPLTVVATQLRAASDAWRAILGDRGDRPPDPDAEPFDIRDWEAAAREIGTSAAELRALAAELNELTGAAQAERWDQLLDSAFRRAVLLIAIFFASLLLYRLVTSRVVRQA